MLRLLPLASAVLVLGALFACSSDSSASDDDDDADDDSASTAGTGPALAASQVGASCSGVGTSPGDTAIFADEECAGGLCVADARGDLATYCTADCDANSCPAGSACEKVSFGTADTKHACLNTKGGSSSGSQDAGSDAAFTCNVQTLSGAYTITYETQPSDVFCPDREPAAIEIEKGVGVASDDEDCTTEEDAAACSIVQTCPFAYDERKTNLRLTVTAEGIHGTYTTPDCTYLVTLE